MRRPRARTGTARRAAATPGTARQSPARAGVQVSLLDKSLSSTLAERGKRPILQGYPLHVYLRVQMGHVAIYCRVSTDDQSCARRERDLKAFAKRAGHHVVGVFQRDGVQRQERPR